MPAVHVPAVRVPAVRMPAVRVPAVRVPVVHVPAVRVSAVRVPLSSTVYMKTGFLALQRNIDLAVMHHLQAGVDTDAIKVELQRFPHPLSKAWAGQLRAALPLVLMLSFLCSVIDTTKDVVKEKEAQLKVRRAGRWGHWRGAVD